ncbi:MAG: T9SS C-terminal target domain-containing protein [Porphyromonadaceae bacterium]|nr:MAG: T9SS C-terminal target domain-containing protein [Porphyromonadaceae bacterium]
MYIKTFSGNFSLRARLTALLLIASSLVIEAQWSNNPSSNLTICQDGSPYGAKIVYSNYNLYFITYAKGINKNSYLFLQALDANGYPQFEGNGMMISNQPQKGNYDLNVNLTGDALIALSEVLQDGTRDISMYKIDQTGKLLWGENGTKFIIEGTNEGNPRIVVNQDNSIYLILNRYNKTGILDKSQVFIYRISNDGIVLWNSQPKIIKDNLFDLLGKGAISFSDGSLMIAFTAEPPIASDQILVKKIDNNGRDLWAKDLPISTQCIGPGTSVETYAGEDGIFYITWHANACYPARSIAYIQGITEDGNILWPEPGLKISENNSINHYIPVVQGINSNGDVLVLWYNEQESSNGTFFSLYGQLISQTGELKWGSDGIEIKNKFEPGGSFASIINDTVVIVYRDPIFSTDIFQVIKAVALTMDGHLCWPDETLINDLRTSKYMYGFTPIIGGQGVMVFGEEGGSLLETRLLAQNIRSDGTIGLKSNNANPQALTSEIRVFFRPEEGILINGLNGKSDIVIFNTLGQIMHQGESSAMQNSFVRIYTNRWKPGIYFVKILQSMDKVTFSKIVIN